MQIHLSDISSSEGKSVHYSAAFEMEDITFQQGTFPVLEKKPVELTITNTGDRVLELEGSGLVTVGIPCDRCLEEICSRCGKNLNNGPCGCTEEPKDPRMAAISDIFSKFKEV